MKCKYKELFELGGLKDGKIEGLRDIKIER